MDKKALVSNIQKRHGDLIVDVDLDSLEPSFRVAPENWLAVAKGLKQDSGLNYLACLTSVDRGDGLEAIYNVQRMGAERLGVAVKIAVPYDNPTIPSVESVWRTADWHEREAFDLMGIRFSGHPDLKRILCAEDWVGHPLRKDYQSPDYYHGIRNNVV